MCHPGKKGLKMDPNPVIRKPLRARKTMTPSSRKQVEILRNLHGLGKAGNSYSVDNYVQLEMIGTESLNYSSSKETTPDLKSKEMSAKEPVAKLVVNSEISIYNGGPDVPGSLPYNGCSTDTNVKQFLSAGSLQDLLITLYEKESDSPVSKPVEVHLYSRPTNQPLGCPEEVTAPVASCSSETPTSDKTEKVEESPESPAPVVVQEEHDSLQFQEGKTLPDDALRERRTSECKDAVSCKHVSSSDETRVTSATQTDKSQPGLEKIKCLIRNHIENSMGDVDSKLQRLNERIDHTQCLRKHEGISIRIIKKISQLHRRVNSVVDFHKAQLSKKVNLPGTQPKTTILNVPASLPGSRSDPPMAPKRRSAQPGEVPSKTARSSAKETCLKVETSVVQAKNSTDAQQKRASSDTHSSAEAPGAPKTRLLIDLTEEEDANRGEDAAGKHHAQAAPADHRASREEKQAEVSIKTNPPPGKHHAQAAPAEHRAPAADNRADREDPRAVSPPPSVAEGPPAPAAGEWLQRHPPAPEAGAGRRPGAEPQRHRPPVEHQGAGPLVRPHRELPPVHLPGEQEQGHLLRLDQNPRNQGFAPPHGLLLVPVLVGRQVLLCHAVQGHFWTLWTLLRHSVDFRHMIFFFLLGAERRGSRAAASPPQARFTEIRRPGTLFCTCPPDRRSVDCLHSFRKNFLFAHL
ncbi:activating transcription factor 7-interacting protein 2 isoform X2 [Heteronotia binoei]|uniref:activating transcription factor 7-interacting protein 2 isoform X2 n=1 Tax=Heteronotia binoei TaxID=13085 RepID=UPI00292F85CB|nr:activating transcription factor 7-interacting protein 2 isoform X2 [Heteronotia binoei]